MRSLTEDEVERHDALCGKGWALIKGRILLHGAGPTRHPGLFERWQLFRAARCFEQALQINPEGWQSMWVLGKILQRLGRHERAFDWFFKAHALKPDQPDVAREASLEALDVGRAREAVELSRAALASCPDDAGLMSNLALACCLAGEDAEAERWGTEAVRRAPSDAVAANALAAVRRVASGGRARPKRLRDMA